MSDLQALVHALGRATGLSALVLAVLSLAWGLVFSARATGARRKAAWWLDLHGYLGGLAFGFTVTHVLLVLADSSTGIGLLQALVPMTATGWAWGITWGVLATWAFGAVVFTSWPRRRLSRRAWLAVHLSSVPATVAAAGHAWMVAESRPGRWFAALLAVLVGGSVYPGVLRLARVLDRRSSRRGRPAVPA